MLCPECSNKTLLDIVECKKCGWHSDLVRENASSMIENEACIHKQSESANEMFASFTDPESDSGIKGMFARFFSKPCSLDDAASHVESISMLLFILSILSTAISFVYGSIVGVAFSVFYAIIVIILRYTKSTIAAFVLLTISVLNALFTLPNPGPIVWVLVTARAVQNARYFTHFKQMQLKEPKIAK